MSNEIPIVKIFSDRQLITTIKSVNEISEVVTRKSGDNQSMFCTFHVIQDSLISNSLQLFLSSIS